MELKIKTKWTFRLPRVAVGCGVQGDDWLALAVRGHGMHWTVEWALQGTRGDQRVYDELARKVWRRPFYVAPWEAGLDKEMSVSGVDVEFLLGGNNKRPRAAEVDAAVRTQMMGRFTHAAEPSVLCGLQAQGPDGQPHWVGAVTLQDVVKQTYREWKSGAGVINPHVSSNAIALANVYLALYPAEKRAEQPGRLLVLESRGVTHAVLMDDWRLVDSLHYEKVGTQELDPLLVAEWIEFFAERNEFRGSVAPLIMGLGTEALAHEDVEIWHPLAAGGPVRVLTTGRLQINERPDLAALAIGMALQGA